jgi:hypothetical protein
MYLQVEGKEVNESQKKIKRGSKIEGGKQGPHFSGGTWQLTALFAHLPIRHGAELYLSTNFRSYEVYAQRMQSIDLGPAHQGGRSKLLLIFCPVPWTFFLNTKCSYVA